jgi:bacteriophage HK97-gp10 putative tail-component
MASTFRVTHPEAPRRAVDPNMRDKAEQVASDASELTPVLTGQLAASWTVEKAAEASYRVSTSVAYARYVEYGTRFMHGAAMMGRALAKARHE